MTDAAGLTTTYSYDALGRTIAETRPGFRDALLVTSNEYNTANQLVATRSCAIEQSEQKVGNTERPPFSTIALT